jgi:RNA polymerase sigma factor for flagellar operon FliA
MMVAISNDTDLLPRFLKTRDPGLREEMVLRYVPLVRFVLGRLGISQGTSNEYEDLVSQGLLGLIEAIDRYNPEFGTQFSTYATVRIRGKILDYLRALDWLSRTSRQRTRAVQETISDFWLKNQRDPSDEEIAEGAHLELGAVQQALVDASRMLVSLDSVIDFDQGEESSLHETLADENQPDPSDVIDEDEMRRRLAAALQSLQEREQMILTLYYFEELTFKEIGAILEITESRVCQLHARAITHLKIELSQGSGTEEKAALDLGKRTKKFDPKLLNHKGESKQ